jgi:hypothetical protein
VATPPRFFRRLSNAGKTTYLSNIVSRVCTIPDCHRRHEARGLCRAHYRRARRHGNPLAGRCPRGQGIRQHPLAELWRGIVRRCTDPNFHKYRLYGALGVRICDRWLDFDCFIEDVGERPSPRHSIDRWPDPYGNYEPGNWLRQGRWTHR